MATSESLGRRASLWFIPSAFPSSRDSPIYFTSLLESCRFPYPGGSPGCLRLLLGLWGAAFTESVPVRQPPCQTFRTGLNSVTRLQNSLNAATRSLACPATARTFTTELSPPMSPSDGVSYDYASFSQFPRPDFHRQDSRPYGLRTDGHRWGQKNIRLFPMSLSVLICVNLWPPSVFTSQYTSQSLYKNKPESGPMNTSAETTDLRWRSWRYVIVSIACVLLGIPVAATFYSPTLIGYVQLPGVVIALVVACCCTACFLRCPRLPITPKVVALVLIILPIFCFLQFLAYYYLHVLYRS